jgi:uncharacterized protein
MWNKTPDMPMPPNWCYYVRTKDTKAAVPVIEKSGGKILNGPMEVPGGDWVAQGMDPQGAVFAISSKP